MDSKDFPSIFNYFSDKIDQLNDLVPLVKACKLEALGGDEENLPKLSYLSAIVQEMEEMLCIVETELDRQKDDLLTKKDLISKKIEQVQDHCNHVVSFKGKFQVPREIKEPVTVAVPAKVSHQPVASAITHHHPPTNKGTTKSVRKEDNRIRKVTTTTTVHDKAKHPITEYKTVKNREIPVIEPISKDEFDEIPQYMRGRITHSSLNQGLAALMETITAKYSLLSTHSSRFSDEEMKRAQLYKSQESSDTAGQLFCTTDDLKMYSNLKETNTTKIVLTCLRHCKRIKEIRGPGKLIRYAVVKP